VGLTGIKIFLIWLVLSIWVTNLLHDVVLLVENVVTYTSEISVLQIGIKSDLYNTVANSIEILLLG
jgi:hypothetical protein